MTDAPDPLGKRALFWAPAERDEGGPRRPSERDVPGKHALFSEGARTTAARPHAARAATNGFEDSAPTPRPPRSAGIMGPITVDCSSCGKRSGIDLLEFLVLHLPVWLWRPGRGFTRFMTCPACRRRTWVSASWAPWAR
jgi:hypothetical protein